VGVGVRVGVGVGVRACVSARLRACACSCHTHSLTRINRYVRTYIHTRTCIHRYGWLGFFDEAAILVYV
jgi:hypothetical protein